MRKFSNSLRSVLNVFSGIEIFELRLETLKSYPPDSFDEGDLKGDVIFICLRYTLYKSRLAESWLEDSAYLGLDYLRDVIGGN